MPRRKSLLILADVFGLTEQQLLLGEAVAAPRNSRPADAGQQLHEVIDAAKRQIAHHAGVDKSQVHIRIDY
jgi:hypothetical protein